ncbi:hypothetical protein HFV04_021745 [Pseudomonas sp. BIGb0427]|uniref:hypothetical protein n=1 Tax=Pseudomonas sp. BIGb0427 TaxID=2724470 RepID=UPI0018A79ADE|nr:hypothetical protein [Pseudomonas sp. BIGb0427]QPG62124.1 hypothetical protein HFV04_021745 [Pseudomonas sp. BIGb0427]
MTEHLPNLKTLAEACIAAGEYLPDDAWTEDRSYSPAEVAWLEFAAQATPVALLALLKDLESHKRMLLAAACDIGAIGQALGADENDDGSEIEGLAAELRKDAERYRWLRTRDVNTISQGGVFAGITPQNLVINEETLDEAVDAAIAKGARP